jgi:hypothetical protein
MRTFIIILIIISIQIATALADDCLDISNLPENPGLRSRLDEVMQSDALRPTLEIPDIFFNNACSGGETDTSDPDLVGVPLLSISNDKRDAEYNDKVERYNPIVRDKALQLASDYPGTYSIDQVCSIYENLYKNWRYVNDPVGSDYINYANESIKACQRGGCSGAGDCDDYAVLMASLIESIGGTTRIVNTETHAYAEVYVGDQVSAFNVYQRLESRYGYGDHRIIKMFFHENLESDDYWLNLDWTGGRPGSPYSKSNESLVVWASSHSYTPLGPLSTNKRPSPEELSRIRAGLPARQQYGTVKMVNAVTGEEVPVVPSAG